MTGIQFLDARFSYCISCSFHIVIKSNGNVSFCKRASWHWGFLML